MSDQEWKIVTNKKKNKVKTIEPIKFNPIPPKPVNPIPPKPVNILSNISTKNTHQESIKIKKISSQMSKSIVDTRLQKKWTQIELARKAGIDVKLLIEIEKSNCLYNPDIFNKICKALEISIERNCI